MPLSLKTLSFLCKISPIIRKLVERQTHALLNILVEHHANGTRNWYLNKKDQRIFAFFKNYETYEAIPDWEQIDLLSEVEPVQQILEHGYDESKQNLSLMDLQKAAHFRGGKCISTEWIGDLYHPLIWKCAFNHEFTSKPFTILKAGHWCPVCVNPPWNGDEQARKNPFFAQVWNANHGPAENNSYSMESFEDIAAADEVFKNRKN